MNLRASRVLRKLRAGGVASCVKLNLADARVAEIAALCGLDCIWTDKEHVPNTLRDVEHQVRAAKMHDVDTLVRVQRGSYSDMIRPLELDAAGIMIPHLMSAAEARDIARLTRFHPIGRRPLDGGNSDGAYCLAPLDQYIEHANRERFIVVQIEGPEPMEEIDEIAATEGIDMLFFGPGDFTQAIGNPGGFDDPRVEAARRKVAEAATRHGKFAGTVGTIETLPTLIEMGYRFLSVGADVVALTERFGAIAKAFGHVSSGSTTSSLYEA